MRTLLSRLTHLVAVLAASELPARAQCQEWSPGFASGIGDAFTTDNTRGAIYDDGAGPRFYAGFRAGVQRWTGTDWEIVLPVSAPDFGFGCVRAAFDAGVPVLLAVERPVLATANTSRVWRFDGSTWTQLGAPSFSVWAVDFLDDGSTTSLVAAGGDVSVNAGYVARWNGTTWLPIGTPLAKTIFTLDALRIGGVSQLYVGGLASLLGTSSVATWNGIAWQPVPGLNESVRTLRTYDAGSGARLYAGLSQNITNAALRSYDGTSWTQPAPANSVATLEVADLGAGPRLLVGGSSLHGLLVYDGATLAPPSLPSLVAHSSLNGQATTPSVGAMAGYFDGATPHLFALGFFDSASDVGALGFAEWNGTQWRGAGLGTSGPVNGFAHFDFGAGPELVAVGSFQTCGNTPYGARGIASWNGQQWTNVGGGLTQLGLPASPSAACVTACDFGAGPRLFAGGAALGGQAQRGFVTLEFGFLWTAPFGDFGRVNALCTLGSGPGARVFAGGQFTVAGSAPGDNIFQYDGGIASPLGVGLDNSVTALTEHDEGAGPRLFAGGTFANAGFVAASRIARWDGANWSALGAGISSGNVNALRSFGGELWAGGTFSDASGVPVASLARWNGAAWSDVPGGGANGSVLALHVHDDGRGPALYVGGTFSTIGGIAANGVARFDGTAWEAVAGGIEGPVRALASFDDDGDGDDELFVGGSFARTATIASGNVARLEGCPLHASFCSGDGSLVDHTTPCPCGNNGAPGRGCAHSFDANGAQLSADGATTQDAVVLHSEFTPGTAFTLFMQHANPGDTVFHDGVLCAGNPLVRLRGRSAAGGEAFFPNTNFAQDATTTLSLRGGVTIGSGATRYYAAWFRNASSTFCPPTTANVTNGVRVVW